MTDPETLTAALDKPLTTPRASMTITAAARERLAQLPPYSDELLERIAKEIHGARWYEYGPEFNAARAVLDALNKETE